MHRRSFLIGAIASLATPAIVRAEILMPVRKVLMPPVLPYLEDDYEVGTFSYIVEKPYSTQIGTFTRMGSYAQFFPAHRLIIGDE